jgi:hypothetical protein
MGLLLGAVLGVVGCLLLVVTRSSQDPELASCLALGEGRSVEREGPRTVCLQDLWAEAVSVGNETIFLGELERLIEQGSAAGQECHIVGHRVGVSSFSTPTQALELLAKDRRVVCEFGFEHGILDGLAAAGVGIETYNELARICVKRPDTAQRNLCIDGAGHSIWQRYRDMTTAVTFCHTFQYDSPDSGEGHCLGGVIMQFFREDSVTGKAPAFTPSGGVEAVKALCSHVNEINPDVVATCYYYGAEPVALLFSQEVAEVLNGRIEAGVGAVAVEEASLQATRRCASYGEYLNMCIRRLSESGGSLVRGDTGLLNAYCAPYERMGQSCS